MSPKIILLCIISFISVPVFASDLDVLIARTALALGDEYGKLTTKYQSQLVEEFGFNPTAIVDPEEEISPTFKEALDKYNYYLSLALEEYKIVLCETNCPSPLKSSGLEMPDFYNFLRREAFVKYDMLANGSSSYGTVGKYATIYAVNSSFEDHLLGKLSKLVEVQQRLDSEARKMFNTFAQLENSYVDLDTEQVVGIDQGVLREQNYSLDTQTQISGYQSCVESSTTEDNFEKDELVKSMSQIDLLVKNIKNNFDKIYTYVYENSAGDELFTIQANQGWQNTNVVFEEEDRAYFDANGSWIVRGAVIGYQDSHLYFPPASLTLQEDKGWSCCKIKIKIKVKDIINYVINPYGTMAKFVLDNYIMPAPKALKEISASNKAVLKKISQGLDTRPDGYYFSFSSGATDGISSGTSVNAGINLGPLSIGGTKSRGESSGVSAGTGGTYGLKLNTSVYPDAPIGALIGSFCSGVPDGVNCPYFIIGTGNVVDVPSGISGKTLWLRANEHPTNFSANRGSLQVKIKKQVAFKNYWDQYRVWFDKECDVNGYDCGLAAILDNVAYVPDPYTVAKSAFVKQFPDFPDEVSNLILQEINSIVQLMVAHKEVESKELSRELHSTKIASCRDQLKASQEKLANTRELISTYQRRQQNIRTKEILLDTSKRYYESELAALNNIRSKNLERIKRYYALTVNSYNYLYLDEFKVEGEPTQYFEGDYYKSQIDLMEDLILEITTVNDLLNPNRGFVIYQLSDEELDRVRHPDYRQRKTQVKLDYNNFLCQGFNIENQARVMIEKVGILLDIDPKREHLFFKNPNVRSTQVLLGHGLENRFYNFNGEEKEFWMPSQKRNVSAHSNRVLVDANSDYFQLRDSRFFERLSFRKTSFATTWQLDMLDPGLLMYMPEDFSFSEPLLQGMKLVFWFNSAELQGEEVLNRCLISPMGLIANPNSLLGTELNWEFPTFDRDYQRVERFTIYRSTHQKNGFKPVAHLNVDSCYESSGTLNCSYTDELVEEGRFYYQVRSSYKASGPLGSYLDGVPSNTVEVTLAK